MYILSLFFYDIKLTVSFWTIDLANFNYCQSIIFPDNSKLHTRNKILTSLSNQYITISIGKLMCEI